MHGIVIAALGFRIYGEMAFNLVASLKKVSPNIPIALLYDDAGIATLQDKHRKLFDYLIEIEGAEITVSDSKHYQFAKLLTYKFSPFDFSIYIDADTLWGTKPIEELFERYKNHDFHVGAHSIYDNGEGRHSVLGYTYWGKPYEICVYHDLKFLQQTISGLYYFNKSDVTGKIFDIAQKVYRDPGTPNYVWANGKPDEYCFNVALSKMGIKLDRNCPIYFDKLHGAADENGMFGNHYGIAIGGHKISHQLKGIYNRRAQLAAEGLGMDAFPCVEKYIAIPARNMEENAVRL